MCDNGCDLNGFKLSDTKQGFNAIHGSVPSVFSSSELIMRFGEAVNADGNRTHTGLKEFICNRIIY